MRSNVVFIGRSTIILICIVVLFGVSLYQASVPSIRSEHLSSKGFSLKRVHEHLEIISSAPHPTGSDENDQVRKYITEQIRKMGYTPQIQTAEVLTTERNRRTEITAVTVNNIMVRMHGTSNTKSVLLMSHYDSEPYSPGANDDGVAVAAMLETLRVMSHSERPRNDIIFLFTDAEELGLLGAKAFWHEHAWADDAGIVLNFDARGSSGASLMFETSSENGWLIREYAKSATYPTASSVMNNFKALKSNDTDMSVSNDAGVSGLNFAYVDGWIHYHNINDDIEHVDQKTLIHQSLNMLELTQHFSNMDLSNTKASDQIYFNLFGKMIYYSEYWVIPSTIFISIVLCAVFILGVRKQRWTVRGILQSLCMMMITAVLAGAATYGLWWTSKMLWADSMINDTNAVYKSGNYHIAFILLTTAISIFIFSRWRRRIRLLDYLGGLMALVCLLLILTSIYFPGGTYLFTWPLLCGLTWCSLALFVPRLDKKLNRQILMILFAAPIIILLSPIIRLALLFMDMEFVPYLMGLVVLLFAFCWPALEEAVQFVKAQYVIALSLMVMIIVWSVTAMQSEYNEEFPRGNNLFYVMNTEDNKAYWVSKIEPDEWVSQFIRADKEENIEKLLPNRGRAQKVWLDQAPLLKEAGPQIKVIRNEVEDEHRILELKVLTPSRARFVLLQVENTDVENFWMNGKQLNDEIHDGSDGKWRLKYINFPGNGIDLTLVVKNKDFIQLRMLDGRYGLPEFEGHQYEPRNKSMMPMYGFDGMTMMTSEFEF